MPYIVWHFSQTEYQIFKLQSQKNDEVSSPECRMLHASIAQRTARRRNDFAGLSIIHRFDLPHKSAINALARMFEPVSQVYNQRVSFHVSAVFCHHNLRVRS